MTAQTATAMQPTKSSVPVKQESADTVSEFDRIYDSIAKRAFQLFEGNGQWPGRDWDDWFRAERELVRPIPVELKETDASFSARLEVPGFSQNDLEIVLEPRLLRISGKHETKQEETKGKTIWSEFCADQVLRSIALPADVDTSKASAQLKDGVLTIDLPKAAQAKAIKIEATTA
jgi:HSP20 family protein